MADRNRQRRSGENATEAPNHVCAGDARFQAFCTSSHDIICESDESGTLLFVSDSVRAMLGLDPSELIGRSFMDALHPDDVEPLTSKPENTFVADSSNAARFRARHRNGSWRTFDSTSQIFRAEDDSLRALSIVRDVTEKTRSEGRIHALLDAAPDAIIIVNASGVIQLANQMSEGLFGYTREQLVGLPVEDLIPASARAQHVVKRAVYAMDPHRRAMAQRPEVLGRRQDGSKFEVDIALSPVHVDDELLIFASIRDASVRRTEEARIRKLAFFDTLTELPNRQLFAESARQALALMARGRQIGALLFLDLDRFKIINDTLGHQAGDDVLRQAASRLLQSIRESDCVARPVELSEVQVARLGGDEFTIMLSDIGGTHDAKRVAERIVNRLSEAFEIGGQDVFVGASIGIAMYPSDGEDVELLVKRADAAMYTAKRSSSNHVRFYTARSNATAEGRLVLESRLRRAFDREELSLDYQPVWDAAEGRLVGAEALLRWRPAGLAPISPAEFIPVAEETGLILPIGEWALRAACVQLCTWCAAGFEPIRMMVNVSAVQLRDEAFAGMVQETMRSLGMLPDLLHLEITESMVLDRDPVTIGTLNELSQEGVGLVLDDFGTGYSSLSSLRNLPIDLVKIDRSFVAGISGNNNDAALVTAIIAMAHSLRLRVVAEGVETPEQAEFLRRHGCEELQGFLLGTPATPAEFSGWLRCGARDGR